MRQLAFGLALTLIALGGSCAEAAGDCAAEVAAAEARHHLPAGLLTAMALVESGRAGPDGTVTPWAWTLRAEGEGRYFETTEDAQREARKRLAAGDALIDVGCLQIDLYHHPDAFPDLAAAFDPRRNSDYAAEYLAKLAQARGSWLEAVAAYNAGRPADGIDYLSRVLYLWRGTKLVAGPQGHGFALDEIPDPLDAAARFYAAKDYGAAMLIYTDLLRHHSDDRAALTGSAEVLLAEGKTVEARDRFEQALAQAQGNDPAALSGLLRAIDTLPPEQALTALLSARADAPNSAEIPTRLALLLADAGHLDDAAQTMGEAVRLAPENLMLRLDRALLFDRAGNARDAVSAYADFLAAYHPGDLAEAVPLDAIRRRAAYLKSQLS